MLRKLAGILLLVLALWWWWRPFMDNTQRELFNRIWVSAIPEEESDIIDLLLLRAEEEQGRFETGSAWRGDFEVFVFRRDGEGYTFTMMQDGRSHHVRARVQRDCRPGADYCLTLEGAPRGPRSYLSRHGWETSEDGNLRSRLR